MSDQVKEVILFGISTTIVVSCTCTTAVVALVMAALDSIAATLTEAVAVVQAAAVIMIEPL